ncbi:DUF2845 domain-containing protein [Agarilytica rhodophyticola]|uniref:DUF2845 domain-containing protein n=1 Tax=Agarilytica rhodophyticola TaxID=1737490 RepID=UPI001319E59B|nr:DUF2845 domain-containing protein [Agarilytica rhodophyticola]
MRAAKFCLLIICLSATTSAFALRCGSKVIKEGDGLSRVANYCGEPENIRTRSIFRSGGISGSEQVAPNRRRARVGIYDEVSVEIEVEEWEYNFGPNKLSRRIVFEDGVVVRIKSIGYGY